MESTQPPMLSTGGHEQHVVFHNCKSQEAGKLLQSHELPWSPGQRSPYVQVGLPYAQRAGSSTVAVMPAEFSVSESSGCFSPRTAWVLPPRLFAPSSPGICRHSSAPMPPRGRLSSRNETRTGTRPEQRRMRLFAISRQFDGAALASSVHLSRQALRSDIELPEICRE